MSESSTGGSNGKAGFTRRRFIIGTVGVSAVAALGGAVVRAPRALASGAPSGPPTTTPPAPTLAFSTRPITAHNPGSLVKMPDPRPLDVTQRYGEAASVSFTDGLNGQTTYFYHVQLTGLKPGTRYYYQVSDGAAAPSTAGAAFA